MTGEFAGMMLPQAKGSLIVGGIGGVLLTLVALIMLLTNLIPLRSSFLAIAMIIMNFVALVFLGRGFLGFRTIFNSALAAATGGLLYTVAGITLLTFLAGLARAGGLVFALKILLVLAQLACYIVMTITLFKHKDTALGGGLYLPTGILKLIATIGMLAAFVIGIAAASSGVYRVASLFASPGFVVFYLTIGIADLVGDVLLTIIMFLLASAAGRPREGRHDLSVFE